MYFDLVVLDHPKGYGIGFSLDGYIYMIEIYETLAKCVSLHAVILPGSILMPHVHP